MILGFGYDEIERVPTAYAFRMMNAFKFFMERLFKSSADHPKGPNVVIPNLPDLRELMPK